MLCYVYVMLRYVMLCFVMFYALLCYVLGWERRESASTHKDLVAQNVMYDASLWGHRDAVSCRENLLAQNLVSTG